jgi:hypothetical protein
MSAEKLRRHPEGAPQTDRQKMLVREWTKIERSRRVDPSKAEHRHGSGSTSAPEGSIGGRLITLRDRFRGALVGLAVGDALGTTLEFCRPGTFKRIDDMIGGGPFGLNRGEWTDDTSMALCLTESLIELRRFDQALETVRTPDGRSFQIEGERLQIGLGFVNIAGRRMVAAAVFLVALYVEIVREGPRGDAIFPVEGRPVQRTRSHRGSGKRRQSR